MTKLFHRRSYKINKLFLSIIGQWPYQNRASSRAALAIFVFLAASQIIPQIIAVVEFWDDPDVVIESIPPFVIDFACGTKLVTAVINSDKILKIAQHMENDWTSLIHQPEIRVLHNYAETGRLFTIAYAAGMYVVTMLFMTHPVLPQILEALKLTDEYQTKKFPFPVNYYGIDFDTYYYYMIMHSYICVGAILTVIVAIDTMFIMHVQHACGMFSAVGLHLERMCDAVPEVHELEAYPSNDIQELATCIKEHNEAIVFAELLEATYTWSFFFVVGVNTIGISITGFQAVIRMDDSSEEAILYAACTLAQLAHLFFQCFFSQRLINHSEEVRDHIYQAEWYKMSLGTQKLINLVTMRTYMSCQLTAGKFMVMSLENFTSIVKTSMSYFTLLRSMQ